MSRLRWLGLAVLLVMGDNTEAWASSPVWLRIKADDFVVYSNASQKESVGFAVEYAAFHQLFREMFVAPGHQPPPSVLILFRRDRELQDHAPPSRDDSFEIANYAVEIDGVAVMALSLAGDHEEAFAHTIEFETIWALRSSGYYLPVWMAQGTGRVLSTMRLAKGRCRYGQAEDAVREPYWSGRDVMGWERFFSISTSSPEYRGDKRPGVYHSQAWALMHWILFNDGSTRERFDQLATRLRNTLGPEAVQAVMGETTDHFNKAIRRHLGEYGIAREMPFDEARVRANLVVTPAPEAEVLVQTAGLLESSGRIPESDRQLDRARQLSPELPSVKEAWARRLLREDKPDEALQLYRDAIAANTANYSAYLYSAQARLAAHASSVGLTGTTGGQVAVQAAEEIRRALALNPGNLGAYQLLGKALSLQPKVTEEQIAELSRGLSPGEKGEEVRYYRGLLLLRSGRTEEGLADMQQVVDDPDTSAGYRRYAQDEISTAAFKRVEMQVKELVQQKKFDEARKLVIDAETREPDPYLSKRYMRLLSEINSRAR